jgi:hypothetical protein
MIEASDSLYKYNCAIALGLLGDTRSLGALRQCLKMRDCFFFTDNRRSNQFRSAIAVCLLGRLGGADDLAMLFDILSKEEIDRAMYHTLKANYLYHNNPDRNFVYFSMLTHTCMAIYKIYKRCALDMKQLHRFFCDLFDDGSVLHSVTEGKRSPSAEEETKGFIAHLLHLTDQN